MHSEYFGGGDVRQNLEFDHVADRSSTNRLFTCTGIMATCWLYVSVRLLDAACVSLAAGWLAVSLAASEFLAASHSAKRQQKANIQLSASGLFSAGQYVNRNSEV